MATQTVRGTAATNGNRPPKPDIKLRWEFLDPEKAKKWLRLNVHNRPIRQSKVEQYAEAILVGDWCPNGEPIQFGENGDMLNGQHRCLGVIEADRGIWVAVARGVPNAAQETMDIGAPRKLGDILSLRGEVNATSLAAALRGVVQYSITGVPLTGSGGVSVAPQRALAMLARHPEMREYVSTVKTMLGRDRGIRLGVGLLSTFRFLFTERADDETAATWFGELEEPTFGVIRQLRKRLADQKHSHMLHPKTRSALVIKSWNLWLMEDDRPEALKWRPRGEPFPVIAGFEEADD